MSKEQLKELINLIFDTAEEALKGRPIIVMALNAAQVIITEVLLDRIFQKARSAKLM